jgi:hypothetical protein
MSISDVLGIETLTHYFGPSSEPLLSISGLTQPQRAPILERLAAHESLPLRLTRPDYFAKRTLVEQELRSRFISKGGTPERSHPNYFVLGTFSLWESDGSHKVQIPLSSVPGQWISFTLTDSYFNFCATNLQGVPIPAREYHQQVFTMDELPDQLERHGLPTEDWRNDPTRRFEPYVEAQLWSDQPVAHLLGDRGR